MSDWKTAAKASSPIDQNWRKRVLEQSRPLELSADEVYNLDEAPALVRMEVGALDKPEDRLKALRKTYPDAVPYGDDGNFIYTNPETGKVQQYNQQSWMPGIGDLASIGPEVGEAVGGGLGAILGAIGGGAAGSAVPILGTAAGGVAAGMAGAGTGSVIGKELTQRGLQAIFGNEDSRTGGEQARDAAITFGLGAAGEGVGRALGAGVQLGKNAWNRRIIGEADDPALAAQRLTDWESVGFEPTVGMVNGNNKTGVLEHAIAGTRSGDEINRRINDAFTAQAGEFDRIVGGLGNRPLSKAEAGEALQAQAQAARDAGFARSEQLYDNVAAQVAGTSATVSNTARFLEGLAQERAGYGEFATMTRGPAADRVIETTNAILSDARNNGMSFDDLRRARTYIGQLAQDSDDRVLTGHLNSLYGSLTADLEGTAAASSEDGLRLFRKANNQFRRQMDTETGFGRGSTASTLITKDSDQILDWSLQQNKAGGNRIAQVRRTIQRSEGGADAWNQVVAGVTDRMGRNSADEFDPGLFMRQWNAMSEEAKSAIYAGTANAQYRRDLDKLARIGDTFTKYRKNANHSNTENHRAAKDSLNPLSKDNAVISFLGLATTADPVSGMALGAMRGGATHAASRLSQSSRAKLLTSPEAVRWMTQLPAAELRRGGLAGHFAELNRLRKSTRDQALAAAIGDYLADQNYRERNDD